MKIPEPRGDLSAWVSDALTDPVPTPLPLRRADADASTIDDEDLQLALWMLYELHYRGFDGARDDAEWDPVLLSARRDLEAPFEREVRELTRPHLPTPEPARIVEQIQDLIAADPESGLVPFIQRRADLDQFTEFMKLRSIYHLKESDPQSFVLPRLDGPAKVALAELQYDEYGAGRPEMLHQDLFRSALRGCGLSDAYGAYADEVDASTFAVNNVMSLFALHRRLRGASLGHLAVFEATSSIPCRRISRGIRRLGLPESVSAYYDEHVEADAAHEQVALRDICGTLVAERPELAADVLLGAQACLSVDGLAGERLMERWTAPASDSSADSSGTLDPRLEVAR